MTGLQARPASDATGPAAGRPLAAVPARPTAVSATGGRALPLPPATPPELLWQSGKPVAIAVEGGRAEFEVPLSRFGSGLLVVVSALSRGPGPFPLRLNARLTPAARMPALAAAPVRHEVRLKPVELAPPPGVALRLPPRQRTFHLMVRDGDVASASNYLAVHGRLRAVGQRVQVYVDGDDLAHVGEDVLLDLVATFDNRVFATASSTFGRARDVDGDGRFTVLISHWLTRLAGGRHAVDGYVRAADFDATLAPPFGNRCDMMYLSTALAAGPHLRTVLAHEYTHAVTLSAKAFAGPALGPAGSAAGALRLPIEEEGWLDEALAHLVEDLHGFSRSNLDYRISAFLSQPVRYRLVVEDYYAADLFRSHGNRGATYLFLRWCADRFGPALLPALIRSEQRGTTNLETVTGVPFDELYRQWSVALYLSGLDLDQEANCRDPEADSPRVRPGSHWTGGYQSLTMRGRLEGWELAGPRPVVVTPGGAGARWSATGTSSQFVVVTPPTAATKTDGPAAAGAITVVVAGPPESELQVTALPLPAGMARLELGVRAVASQGRHWLHASLRERQGVGVHLTALAWEPLVPAPNPRAARFRLDSLDSARIVGAFGSATLEPHGSLTSTTIALAEPPGDVPYIVKAVGTDAHGHRVAAWAEVAPIAEAEGDGEDEEPNRCNPMAEGR